MNHVAGILGYYIAVACLATLIIKECKSEITRSSIPLVTNETTDIVPEIVYRNEDEDDFVPYQGERFSIFDWTLFKITNSKCSGNVLLSPLSLKIALLLLYEGAQDETAYELASAMQLPATRSATRDRFSTILRSFQTNSSAYTLNIGTRIYIDSNISIRRRYEAIVKNFYDTDAITANLSDSQPLVRGINDWVSNVTHGNIPRMIEDEDSIKNSVMLVMNALFFKGSWRKKYFSPEDTRTGKFYTTDNQTIDVPYMHAHGRFYYSESSELDAKILRLPYDGHKFAMYLVLPRTFDGIEQLVDKVNPFVLTRHVWLMQDLPVHVSIPKFKFEFSSHLEPILRQLGIRDIFDDTATLTGIIRPKGSSRQLKVTDILQKTGIEVNENGTTAYVATAIEIGNKIEDETFFAYHPFLFYLEDESTGTIIYIGKMMNPLDTTGTTTHSNRRPPSNAPLEIPNTDLILRPGLNAEDRNNLFNVHFSQVLSKEYRNGNLVSSPVSVKIALTMLMEAANGKAKSEIVSVLRLPENESRREELTQRTLVSLKRNKNGTEIDFSSRLWIHENLRVLDSYKNILRTRYEADVENINFEKVQDAALLVYEWIRRVTRNTISSASLLTELEPDTRLVSTSVIYLKGKWLKSFDKAKTKLQCFYRPDGICRNTYFMKHESTYRYAYIASIEAHVLEIPYSDGKTSMLTLMPSSREKDPELRILSEDLTTVPVSAILENLKERDVTIYLPKFNIENNLNLISSLQRLGIKNIFQSNANLTKMITTDSVYVTNFVQNVKIEIDEEGTLAAADTELGYKFLSSWGNDVKMDRPFLFMIVDSVTSTILFSGRFVEPL
ncbi:unnamed protein product [Xylocopa violacea]|uniref:Serpin domain-containing protein n=1 Tax=Xylocopa violacea TaxID=135666 RepID=A0ABP1P296_XYLVO